MVGGKTSRLSVFLFCLNGAKMSYGQNQVMQGGEIFPDCRQCIRRGAGLVSILIVI